jgi:hypothetical protein
MKRILLIIGLALTGAAYAGPYYESDGHYLGYSIDGPFIHDYFGPDGKHIGRIRKNGNLYEVDGFGKKHRRYIIPIEEP